MQEFEALFRKFGREFAAGQTIFAEGDAASEFFVVNAGLVRESRSLQGMEKLLREIGPGEFFGETALVLGRPRASVARTLEPSRLLVIPAATFQAMVRANKEIAVRLLRRMAAHLDQLQVDVGTLLFRDPKARLAAYLGTLEPGQPSVELAALAGQLALRPGEAEALVASFARSGLVRIDAGRLQLLDPEGLQDYIQFLRLRERFHEL